MKQFPQGIFQTLNWLTKQINILSCKSDSFNDLPTSGTVTLTNTCSINRYVSGSTSIAFPDPSLYKGKTIKLLISNGSSVPTFTGSFTPKVNGNPLGLFVNYTYYTFISDGTYWIGGGLV